MGIELPAELAGVASRAGVAWPQADEDAMRAAATAWRDAGDEISRLATDSDGSAGRTLNAVNGQTGDAARKHWNGFVAPDGHLGEAVKGCSAAAERLEHAAEQVGAAKVEIVRELVALAKNTDAANHASAAGHPTALLGLDTAVRGTSVNVANLTSALTGAVRLDSGVDLNGVTPPVNSSPGAHGSPGGLLGGVVDTVGTVTSGVTHTVVAPVVDTAAGTVDTAAGTVGAVAAPAAATVPGAAALVDATVETSTGEIARGVVEPATAPVEQVVAAPPQVVSQQAAPDATTAPVLPGRGQVVADTAPVIGGVPVVNDGGTTQSSAAGLLERPVPPAEAPRAPMQQPFAAPGPAAAAASVQPGASVAGPGFSGPAAPIAGPVAAPAVGGPASPQRSAEPAQRTTPDGGVSQRSSGQHEPQKAPEQAAHKPVQKPAHDSKASAKEVRDQAAATAFAILPTGAPQASDADSPPSEHVTSVVPTHTQAADVTQPVRVAQPAPVENVAAVFWFQAFPDTRPPVPSRRPARQLPPPCRELDYAAGLRFEPQDHPRSALVRALPEPRPSGRPPLEPGEGLPVDHPDVAVLAEGYDPLGGAHERDWDRRFLVRDEPPEHAWPPGELFPEGGYEEGQAVVLDEGVELDRFGSPEGRVLSDAGTPFPLRSLPPQLLEAGYHRYRVLRPLPVWRTLSAAWFNQPGGGARYRATYPVADLIALGHVEEMDR
jgi:hypothetical protein